MNENDKLEGLLINSSKHVPMIICFDKANTEVLRIEQDGDVIWKGRKVESDAEFKAAMIDLANVMKGNMHPAQPVQPAVAVNEQLLEALITASALINGCNMKIDPVREKVAAAIAAAKAAKAKGGV